MKRAVRVWGEKMTGRRHVAARTFSLVIGEDGLVILHDVSEEESFARIVL